MRRYSGDSEALVAAYVAGASSTALAAQHGVAVSTILAQLRKHGVAIRPKGGSAARYPQASKHAFVAAYRAGASSPDVADTEGVAHATVLGALRAAGVPRRRRGVRSPRLRLPADPTTLRHLAALIDRPRALRRYARSGGRVLYRLCVVDRDPALLDWLAEELGGRVQWDARSTTYGPVGTWQTHVAQDIVALLTALVPYLERTRAEADAFLREVRASLAPDGAAQALVGLSTG